SSSAVAPPTSVDFGAFVSVLTATGRNSIPMSILNSVIITAGSIAGLVLFGSVAAYVIARRTRRWTTITYYLVLVAIILPAQLGTVPLYIGARSIGLTGNARHDLLWIGILMPLSVFLYASF
ncbi:ABC transporter permease, partial [Microbacterium sp. SUBG005]